MSEIRLRQGEVKGIGRARMHRWEPKLWQSAGIGTQARIRVWPFTVWMAVLGLLLTIRLGQLTIVEGTYQRGKADDNRVLGVRTAAPRGILTDRNGEILVRNVPAYKRQLPNTAVASALFESISREQALQYAIQPGERVFFDIKREYLCGEACAPVIGYMGEITQEELSLHQENYVMGDLLGKTGIERMLEEKLRGMPGSDLIEVDARGSEVRTVGRVEQRPGMDVVLTIDKGLQTVLYDAFEGKSGAAVAQDPHTGEVLALVSSPAFNPQDIPGSLKSRLDKPFFNRAISGVYPPGSVFKIVTAIAGLEEGKITRNTLYEDTGEIRVGDYRFGTWYWDEYGKSEGKINVVKALSRSNDIFFYHIGGDVGVEKLAEWARLFGYGEAMGFTALGEAKGLIPTPTWKERFKGERWYLGNTYHMSIGQGDVLATPLQANRMMAAIAAKGVLCEPKLFKQGGDREGCRQLNLQEETVAVVREGLYKACQPGGTGSVFFQFSPQVACKTGTAQQGGEKDEPHAWFTVYAPADSPEIALTVLVEAGGQGSQVAAPIAKKGLEYWFKQ